MRRALVPALIVFLVSLVPITLEFGYRQIMQQRLAVLDREMATRHPGRVVVRSCYRFDRQIDSASSSLIGDLLARLRLTERRYLEVYYKPDADSRHYFLWNPRRLAFERLSHFGECCSR